MTFKNNFLSRAALMVLMLAGFSLSSMAQTVQVGTGSTTSVYFPIRAYYGYSYSQQIYKATELTAGGASGASTITKIRIKQANTEPALSTWTNGWVVYIGNTTNAAFASSSSWIPTSSMTQVYSGNITPVTGGGWTEITLTTPFSWDGTSNLVVAVDENTASYSNNDVTWAAFATGNTTGTRGICYYNDATNPSPTAPPTANLTSNTIDQMQFEMTASSACSGTPTPGNTLSTSSTACSGSAFTLSVQNNTTGSGVTYQWQSSTNGGSTWTNISGATGSSYSATQTATTSYRANVTCGGNTGTSTPLSVGMSAFTACYCIPTTTNGCASGDHVTNVTVAGINNTTGACISGGSYSNYQSSTAASMTEGLSYSVSVNVANGGTEYAAMWIDYNHSGVFDASEFVTLTSTGTPATGVPWTYTGTVVVPSGVSYGNTGLRVRSGYSTPITSSQACSNFSYGETEDYLVNIAAGVACSGTPTPGNTISSTDTATSGTPFNLSIQNVPTTIGNTYQWYVSSDNTTFTAISGATNSTYAATQTGNTDYYYYNTVTCSNSGLSANSTTKTVHTKIVYCVPSVTNGCTDGDVIARVILNTLDKNSGTGCPGGTTGYSNYYDTTGVTTTLKPATTYGCTVYAGQYTESYAAWIDYNNDGVFDNATERIGYTTTPVTGSGTVGVLGSSATFPVTLSCTPPAGVHRMRIRAVYNTAGSAITPCGSASYGETEDYKVTITSQATCAPGGVLYTTAAGSTTLSLAFPVGCATATKFDFNYGVSPFTQGAAGGSTKSNQTVTYNATNDTAYYTITGLNSLTSYDVYYRSRCTGSTGSYSVLAATGTTLAPPCAGTPTADTVSGPSGACSGTSFTLNAVGQGTELGYTYQWEVSTDNGTTWTAITGATSATSASVSQTVASQYRQTTTCTNSSMSSSSNVVSVGMNGFFACYCAAASVYGTSYSAQMDQVTVRAKSVNTSASQPVGDPHYTLNTTDTFSARRGTSVPVTILMDETSGAGIVSVWIDYNHDGTYSASEWNQVGTALANSSSTTILVAIPDTAMLGLTGMRVRARAQGNPNGATDACTGFGSGETEDYLFNITGDTCKIAAKTPGSIVANVATAICAPETRTYTVPFAADADYYNWTAPDSATIVSGQYSNVVTVKYNAGFNASDTVFVKAVSRCGSSVAKSLVAKFRGVPKTPAILADTTLAICPGETRVYHSVVDTFATSLVWDVPAGATIVSGQGNDTITVLYNAGFTMSDTITLTAINGCGSSLVKPYIAKFRGAPKSPGSLTQTIADKVCPGESRTFSFAAPVDFATSYTWSAAGGATVTSGQNSLSATFLFNAGFVQDTAVQVTASNTCGTSAPKIKKVGRRGVPKAPSAILGELYGACGNATTYSVAPVLGADSYQWSFAPNGTVTSGQGTTSIGASFPSNSGTTVLSVGTTNGCGVSATVKSATINSAPNKGVVTGPTCAMPNSVATGYGVTAYGADSAIWTGPTGSQVYVGSSSAGATNIKRASIGASVNVKFGATVGAVKAAVKNNCGAASAVSYVVANCARVSEEESAFDVELMPNPATDQVTVRVNSSVEAKADVRILSVTGQLMMNETMPSAQHGQLVLPISNLAAGMYMVEVTVDGQKMTKQLIKN